MAKIKKTTIVREHNRHVPVSEKNPTGVTVVERHDRSLKAKNKDELLKEIKVFSKNKKIPYPHSGPPEFFNADKFDQIIAEAVAYFNELLKIVPAFDPDMVKALIASESGFRLAPKENKIALGVAQITKETLKALQDPKGELKENLYKGIRQKDLLIPDVAIPLMVRWLVRKKETAKVKLKREPTVEEIILEYKGLLRSRTLYQKNALEKFKKYYADLKK